MAGLLDLSRPVALLADYRAQLTPGSVVAISHGNDDVDIIDWPTVAPDVRTVATWAVIATQK